MRYKEQQPITLRGVIRGVSAAVIATAALTYLGPRAQEEVNDFGENVAKGVEELVDNFHTDSHKGEPIEDREKGPYETLNYDGGRPFPVRRDPDQSRLAGYAWPGQIVEAQAVWGSAYEGYPDGMVEVDGQTLGEWFKIDKLQLVKENDSGEYVEAGVVNDVFVSGNFLTRVQEASDNQADAQ